eukprot:snap_masked-scaffold_3-processed-gene-18.35-mRNA-1 protein AED:1.00 eAED:1.00 QI:0/-1/0/0/-1/1/1/0/278
MPVMKRAEYQKQLVEQARTKAEEKRKDVQREVQKLARELQAQGHTRQHIRSHIRSLKHRLQPQKPVTKKRKRGNRNGSEKRKILAKKLLISRSGLNEKETDVDVVFIPLIWKKKDEETRLAIDFAHTVQKFFLCFTKNNMNFVVDDRKTLVLGQKLQMWENAKKVLIGPQELLKGRIKVDEFKYKLKKIEHIKDFVRSINKDIEVGLSRDNNFSKFVEEVQEVRNKAKELNIIPEEDTKKKSLKKKKKHKVKEKEKKGQISMVSEGQGDSLDVNYILE